MARKKEKAVKYIVSLTQAEKDFLEALMKEDGKGNISCYFGYLISEEFNWRKAEKEKRKPGRPAGASEKKPEDEFDARMVVHPCALSMFANAEDHKRLVAVSEWEDIIKEKIANGHIKEEDAKMEFVPYNDPRVMLSMNESTRLNYEEQFGKK